MKIKKHLVTVAICGVTAVLTLFAAAAIAADAGHKAASGKGITATKLISQTDTFGGVGGGQSTSSTSFTTIPARRRP